MNDLIKKLMEANIPEDKLDTIMKQLLESKFDNELKIEYEKYLLDELNVKRTDSNFENLTSNKTKTTLKILLALALVCFSLFFAFKVFLKPITEVNSVENYLAENVIYQHSTFRNEASNVDQNRAAAFDAINSKEYEKGAVLFESFEEHSDEDFFFMAYSKLMIEEYDQALELFTSLSSRLGKEDQYYEESRLLKAICQLTLNPDMSVEISKGLEQSSWSAKEFQKIVGKK